MSLPLRQWIALGVLTFFGHAALRPALAAAAPARARGGSATRGGRAGVRRPYRRPPPRGRPRRRRTRRRTTGSIRRRDTRRIRSSRTSRTRSIRRRRAQLVTEHRARKGLVIGGAVTFGVSWGLAASISLLLTDGSSCSGTCRDMAEVLWIPIAGPVLAGARDSGSDGSAFWILWSVAELAGVTMFVIGLVGHDVTTYKRRGAGRADAAARAAVRARRQRDGADGALVAPPRALERRQERGEVGLFLVGEVEAERRLVVIDDRGDGRRRCRCGNTARARPDRGCSAS